MRWCMRGPQLALADGLAAAVIPPAPPVLPTHQIAYVLGTEDFFHRKRQEKGSMNKAARRDQFNAWISSKAPAAVAAA